MSNQREWRYYRHTDACASGARAEERAACNCGAEEKFPAWAIRISDMDFMTEGPFAGQPLLNVTVYAQLGIEESGALAFALHDANVAATRIRLASAEKARRLEEAKRIAEDAPPWET